MEPTSRRNFLKGLGISGLFLAGASAYKKTVVYKQDEIPTKELEAQLDNKPVFSLHTTYGEELPPEQIYGTNNMYILGLGPRYKPGTEKQVSVKLIPGPDGKLYVKENDTWRKI